jgi:tetratricopeptide (TPR) repeat protein
LENPPDVKQLHPDNYKYKAFISYRHSFNDTIIANYLYQMLVTEKLSKYLSENESIPEIKRVYKDEEASNASGDLNESIRLALKESKTLIVIISSQTFQSKWIPQEIKIFLELKDSGRIIFLLTEGEWPGALPDTLQCAADKPSPDNPDITGAPGEGWLQRVTVLDIRGKNLLDNLKQLKRQHLQLMAKILDCPAESIDYADVVLRKKKDRRLKTMIIGSSLAFLASIFLLNIIIENIRDEVLIQQRISKKSFFELAGDLVDNSFRIPRVTREMEAVFSKDIQRLSEHCRALQNQKSQAARDDRAADYALLGNLYLLCGDLPRAIEFHERSLDTGGLLKQKKLSYGQVIEATSALLILGDLRMKQGDYDRAVSEYEKIGQLTADYRNQDQDQGFIERIPSYLKNFLIGLHILEYNQSAKIVDLTLNQNSLVTYQRIGEGLYCGGRFSEALNAYSRCFEMLYKMPGAKEKTVQSQLQLASIYNRIGNIHYQLWNLGIALNCHLNSQKMLKDIFVKAPRHQTAIYHLMLTDQNIGDVYLKMGDLKGAVAYYEESIRDAQKIMTGLKGKTKTYRGIIDGYAGLANARLQTGEMGKGAAIYRDIIGMEQDLLQKLAGLPDENFGPKSLETGKAYHSMAYCYLMLHDSGKAVEAAKQALKADSHLDTALSTLAFGAILQGNVPEAKRLLSNANSWEKGRFENLKRYCLLTAHNLIQFNPGNKNLVQFQNWLINW